MRSNLITGSALFLLIAAGCTTYHAAGLSGGFSETQLSPTTYEVRFQGNGYTSAARVQEFLLRRAAELTLEHGYRYFAISDQRGQAPTWGATFHNNSGTVRFLSSAAELPVAADAVIVIKDTDDAAGGRLSPAAKATIEKLTSGK